MWHPGIPSSQRVHHVCTAGGSLSSFLGSLQTAAVQLHEKQTHTACVRVGAWPAAARALPAHVLLPALRLAPGPPACSEL